MLTCVAPRLRRLELPTYPADFNVYYTASLLVHQGHAAQLYEGADTGADPQKALAPAGSPLFHAAQSQGLAFVGLYVYPPILADLLLPLTFLSLRSATSLWLVINCSFLLITALVVVRLLRLPLLSWKAGLILLSLACFTPALQCLVDGQITIFLLLLWATGMLLYQEQHEYASAAVFALATAVKLTPAIVLLPFLIWRRWRFVTAFVTTLLLLGLISLFIDTPQALGTYFAHVLPAMSGSIPYYTNYSLQASAQRLIHLFRTGSVPPFPASLPGTTVLAGRAIAACFSILLLALIARANRARDRQDHLMILGLLSLMAPILSPVSWFHAYSTAFLAFGFLWRDCLTTRRSTPYLIALTAVSLLLGSAVSENVLPYLLFSGHQGLAALLHTGQLLAAIGVVFYQLWRMPAEPVHGQPRNGNNPQRHITGARPSAAALPLS